MSNRNSSHTSWANIVGAVETVIPLWGVLVGTFVLCRIGEYVLVQSSHTLPVPIGSYQLLGLVHDGQAALLLGGGLTAIYVVLFSFSRRAAFWTFTGGLLVLGLAQLGLAYYFATTLQPLGRDLWGYSATEIVDTVRASGTVSLGTMAGALLLIALVVGSSLAVRRYRAPTWVGYVGGGLLVVALLLPLPNPGGDRPSTQHLSTNKTMYLLAASSDALIGVGGRGGASLGSQADAALRDTVSRPYPWLYHARYDDVLGPFFAPPDTAAAQPPNLVFVVFEGLGTAFVGNENPYGGFTPFVDSLSQHSLYWPNTLSTTGRTFGLMPSLFGSLPYAERGFMEMGANMPRHRTLIDVLGARGYETAYYSGFDLSFDNVDQFLERQDLDRIVGRNGLRRRFKGDPGVGERYWGYPDKELFERVERLMEPGSRSPQLSIFHTLQTHDPFVVPDEDTYDRRFERRLRAMNVSEERKARYRTYRDELTAFLYTDDAIRQFFRWYRTRPDFENTIFVITGDHRLIPIPQPSQIARYHVPLLIYSPLLKRSREFHSVSTLADVAPTLMGFLREQYGVRALDRSHWLGSSIDTTRRFRNVRSTPLMRNKNQLIDYLHKEYYLAGDQLYRVQDGLGLAPVTNAEKRRELQRRLDRFNTVNQYVTQQDRLYSPDVPVELIPSTTPFRTASAAPLGETSRSAIDSVLREIERQALPPPDQFQLARQKAFDGQYEIARAIAERLLDSYPDYHGVRLLLGRTYAWSRDFERARRAFREVMRRDSTYADAYEALSDAERWADRPKAALQVINEGLTHHPERPAFLVKKAKVLLALGHPSEAKAVVSTLEQVDPANAALPSLKEQLTP
jgi:lipoteichoic acid synthase